jgi:protocatechuate 3,4-dioxygenase beta subunit
VEKLLAAKDQEIKSLVTQLYQKDHVIDELQANSSVVQIAPNEPEVVALIERLKEENRRYKVQLEMERQKNLTMTRQGQF